MEQLVSTIGSAFTSIPFSPATWIVIFTTLFFVWLFAKANNNPNSAVNWEHLVLDSQNNRASPYKVGYLIGVIVSTWIVIKISDAGNLSLDIFGVYLAFLLGGAGMNSFTKSREYGGSSSSGSRYSQPEPYYSEQPYSRYGTPETDDPQPPYTRHNRPDVDYSQPRDDRQ